MHFPTGFGFSGIHAIAETMHIVSEAEKAGLDSVWMSEDYFQYGAFSLAGACAAITSSINIGIGVINPYTRHPLLSAMEAAALDEIAQGRLILAVGASNKTWIEMQAGIPFSKPLTATQECAQIISGLIADGQIQYNGKCFNTGRVELKMKPFRRDLPIYWGIKGDKALAAAGAHAAGVLLSAGSPVEYVKYAKALIAEGARSVARDPASIKIGAYLPIYIDPDGSAARARMRPLTAELLGLHGAKPIMQSAGITAEQVAPFVEAFQNGTALPTDVSDELVDKLVIAGTPDQCRERLAEYIQAGVDMPILFEATGVCDPLQTIDSIKAYLL